MFSGVNKNRIVHKFLGEIYWKQKFLYTLSYLGINFFIGICTMVFGQLKVATFMGGSNAVHTDKLSLGISINYLVKLFNAIHCCFFLLFLLSRPLGQVFVKQ